MIQRLLLAILLAGCSCERGGADRDAAADAPASDAPMVDAGSVDAGSIDAGMQCSELSPCADAGTDAGGPFACSALPEDLGGTFYDSGSNGSVTSIVWDGSRYVLLWNELESTSPVLLGLYVALAAPDGTMITGSRHRVFPSDQYQNTGILALGDGELGLAYIHTESDGLTMNMRVHFARLDRDGVLVAGSDMSMAELHPPQLDVALAYSPTLAQWGVLWSGTIPLGGGYIHTHNYLTRIDATGAILSPDAVQADQRVSSLDGAIVWAGDRWATIAGEYNADTTAAVAISEIDGVSATITHRITLQDGGQPIRTTLVTDGTLYGAAWIEIDEADPLHNSEAFRTADVGGDALGTEPLVLGDDRSSGAPSIAFDGTTFRVAQGEVDRTTGGVWLTRLTRDGAVIGTPGLVVDGTPPYDPFVHIASDGCNDAIAWTAIFNAPTQHSVYDLNMLAGSAMP